MRVAIKEIIRLLKQTGSVGKTAKLLGVARSTVYRWKRRSARVYGYKTSFVWKGLRRKSTRPHIIHPRLDHETKLKILDLKNVRHFGPKKIKNYLSTPISHMTIHRY